MSENETAHGRLLGLGDEELTRLAPSATHQHRKGGLYRDLGPLIDARSGEVMRDRADVPLRGWLHIHPYDQQLFVRREYETNKFRPLAVS